jgi:hypothetical protein
MSNLADYRIKIVVIPDSKYYYQGKENKVFVKIYKTKKAEANKVRYPGTAMVRTFVCLHCPYVKNYEEVTLYWTGRTFIEGTEYELKLANLQKHWLKNQAERDIKAKAQAEIDDAKATVQDVLNFVRESRRNSANSNVKSNMKAGLTTSEGKELLDRCDRGGEVK